MKVVWSEDIKIKLFETDLNGKLKLSSLFNYFQEAAGNHALDLNVGFYQLKERNLFWVLSRIKVIVDRYPKWGEQLIIETWPKGIDKLFALRDFRFLDKENIPVISGTSGWLLVDSQNHKLHKIEELGIYVPQENMTRHAIAETLNKLKFEEANTVSFKHKVTFNDLDILQHVNNSRYIEWIMDCCNPENLSSRTVKSIQVNYLEETRFGDEVEIKIIDKTNIHFIEGFKGPDKIRVFQAQLNWGN